MDFQIVDLFGSIARLWADWLQGMGLSTEWVSFINALVGALLITIIPITIVVFTIMGERKVIARFQDRLGPNRVGPFGTLQTVPDVIKLLTKEIITPDNVDRVIYNVAPALAVISVILIWAVMPFSKDVIGSDLAIGAIYFVAVSSLGTLSILFAGWSSNNKYALVAAFRVVAQLVSYEVPMVLALVVPVLLSGTMSMDGIVEAQQHQGWFVIMAPIAMLIFFISSTAEVGRSPFDLLEADSEIVAGYNIEYSGMRFAMFFLGEWIHAFTICALTVTLFLGGWHGPFVESVPVLGVVYFMIKMFVVYFIHIWIRTTMPRLRIDHLLNFNWKFLVPLSLANLVVMSFGAKLVPAVTESVNFPDAVTFWDLLPRWGALLGLNVLLAVATFFILGTVARRMRQRQEAAREPEPATSGA